jgi:hypothetical protein
MRRIVAGPFSLLAGLVLAVPAMACSCRDYDPAQEILLRAVIVDGVVTQRDPIAGDFEDSTQKLAKMKVETVWKGDVAAVVTLHFNENSASCGSVPPVGQRLRVGFYDAWENEAWYGSCMELPLDDPELNRRLAEYKAQTDVAAKQAQTGNRSSKLIFAKYLRSNREFWRSMRVYEALSWQDPNDLDAILGVAVLQAVVLGDNEAKATIAKARQVAPSTDEARGKIARAEFEAFGTLDPSWKDWSDLQNMDGCHAKWLKLDNAVFDGARLNECRFVGSSLKGASFRGADIGESDFSGAIYDCATIFPDNFDPTLAGMINAEESCDGSP